MNHNRESPRHGRKMQSGQKNRSQPPQRGHPRTQAPHGTRRPSQDRYGRSIYVNVILLRKPAGAYVNTPFIEDIE